MKFLLLDFLSTTIRQPTLETYRAIQSKTQELLNVVYFLHKDAYL
jgi:hypothetical protein